MSRPLIILGCGYSGGRVARLGMEAGMDVTGLVRSPESAARLEAEEIPARMVNLLDPTDLAEVDFSNSLVLYCAPPPGGGRLDPKMRNFCQVLQQQSQPPAKVVYLSTSGVYGDCQGELVTEETPVNPQTDRARRRLDAEQQLQNCCHELKCDCVILRVTGIYGPDRFPLHRLIEKHPVLLESEAQLTNRIHVDDLARICFAALSRDIGSTILNVSDGAPSSMTTYFNAMADAFGLARPPQIDLQQAREVMNPLMMSYMLESRNMSNRKMLATLEIRLRYPDLAAGLKASAEKMRARNPQLVEQLVSRFGKG